MGIGIDVKLGHGACCEGVGERVEACLNILALRLVKRGFRQSTAEAKGWNSPCGRVELVHDWCKAEDVE